MALEDLRARKLAFASRARIEACANDACGYDACECGAGCQCERPDVREDARKTCEPCRAFKAEKVRRDRDGAAASARATDGAERDATDA